MDADLRSQINTVLLQGGHVQKIQENLLHSLHAHSSNWPTAIQTHALTLLRSGEVTNFPALLNRVIEDVRKDTLAAKANANGAAAETNGKKAVNGASSTESQGLAVPTAVMDEALKVARDSLEVVCEIDEAGN